MDNEKETKSNNIIEEAINDMVTYEKLLDESNTDMIKNILSEEVTKRLDQILKEDSDEDETVIKDDDKEKDKEDTDIESGEEKSDDDKESEVIDITAGEEESPEKEDGSDEWSDFDGYKLDDGTYDLSNAKEEDVIKIYKLLNDEDKFFVKDAEVEVDPEAGKINITDKDSGEQYIVDAAADKTEANEVAEGDDNKMMEIMLNDKDENLEEGGGAGFQHGAAANHVGAVANDAKDAPEGRPHRKGAQKIEETIKEAKTLIAKALNEVKQTKADAEKIKAENSQIKEVLVNFKGKLSEAVLTNMKLGQIVKIITENTTSIDEKKQIVERFEKEAKTIEQAKTLCESITRELKEKGNKTTIEEAIKEEKPLVVESNKVNETPIYVNEDISKSLEMMRKLSHM